MFVNETTNGWIIFSFRKLSRRKYGRQTTQLYFWGREVDKEEDGLTGPHDSPDPNFRGGSPAERIHPSRGTPH